MRNRIGGGKNYMYRLHYIWLVLAVFCLSYYICCAAYAGFASSFIIIWLAAGIFFVMYFIIRMAENLGKVSFPTVVTWGFRICMIVIVISFILAESAIIAQKYQKTESDCEYLLILGCRVRGTEVTKSLRYRLDSALDYLENNETAQIIVSGGQGNGEDISEAQAMKEYLCEHGIKASRIIMEDKSVDTVQNIKYSAEYIPAQNAKVAVVSNDFHVFRAKMIMYEQGFKNVSTIAAQSDKVLGLNYMVREYFAILKYLVKR